MSRIEIDWIYLCPHTNKSFLEAFFINKEDSKHFDFERNKRHLFTLGQNLKILKNEELLEPVFHFHCQLDFQFLLIQK